MKSLISFFRRLQWKLTLSYAVVTAGTVVVLAGLLVAIVIYIDTRLPEGDFSSFYWSKTAFQDNVPYLMDDRPTLQAWLERVQKQGFEWTDLQSYTVRESIDYAHSLVKGSQPIYVLDPQLNLVAAAPLQDRSQIGKPFKSRGPSGLNYDSILEAALVGDKNYYAQSYTLPDGSYVVAFPLRKTDDAPVSAIVIYTLKPLRPPVPANLSVYTQFFGAVAVLMLLVSLPVGALFGWLASRGLRRRLGALSAATKAWSTGDFSVAPRDRSGDEIGELTRSLDSMAEQLQALLQTRDELARVEERNRLARDLHDTVKQQTYAARMQLSAARNLVESDASGAARHLESALQLNRETQQELTQIIDELRPAALDGKGLAQALREYAARWEQHTGTQVTSTISDGRALPLDVEQALYRVAQEALANVARHAEADAVEISLSMPPDRVRLVVADNGRGFEPAAVSSSSLGLASMKQRMESVGGTLQVGSTLAAGTSVTAEVELVPAGAN
jgi:signal transduction histidine kinase